MTKYNLPKPYLSYSQVQLWLKNKNQYRERYYEGKPSPETIETIYGKKIASILEDPLEIEKNPKLGLVPRYPEPEYSLEVEIEGIKVMGYIDSYDPDTHSFYEYKTSHNNGWTNSSVSKHLQLPFYSLLIKTKHKKVNRLCHLVWIETRFKNKQIEFDGHKLEGGSKELELTGRVEIFKKIVPEWERRYVKNLIINCAKEIHEDYKCYKRDQQIYEQLGKVVAEKAS